MSTKRKSAPTSGASPPKKSKTGAPTGPPQFVKTLAPGALAGSSSGSSGSPGSPSKSSGRRANESPNYDFGVTGPQQWLLNPATNKKGWTTVGPAFTVQHKESGAQVPITSEVLGDAISAENNESKGTKIITFQTDGQTLKQIVPVNPLFHTNGKFRLKDAYKNGQSGIKLSGEFVKKNPDYDAEDPESERYIRDEEANKNAETMLFSFPKLVYETWVKSRTEDKAWYDNPKNKKKLHPTLAREWQVLVKDYESAWEAMFDDGWTKALADTTFKEFVWHRVNLIPKTMDVGAERFFATQGEGGKLETLQDADGNPVPYDQDMDFEDFPKNAEFHQTTNLFKQRFSPGKSIYIFTDPTHYFVGNAYTDTIPPHKPGRMYFVGQAYAAVADERNLLALSVDGLTAEQAGNEHLVLHKGDVVEIKKVRGAIAGIMKKKDAKPSPAIKTYNADTLKVLFRAPNSYPIDLRSWEERKSAEASSGGSSYSNYDQFADDDAEYK